MTATQTNIPVLKPSCTDAEIEAVTEVLRSGWWGMGLKVAQLEEKFARFTAARYAISLNSATAALHLALKVANVNGGEVISPALTFVSTNHAVLYNNARPVFADVQPDTLTLDPDDVLGKITPRTRAIIAVDYAGHPADMQALMDIAHTHNLIVIEDAAHAAGASYRARPVGCIADLTCFSFHAVKNIAAGDGGMVTTFNRFWKERIERLRWLGIDKSTHERSTAGYAWEYDVTELGFKCHMNDLAAALALVQLDRLEETNARRREIATLYTHNLDDLDWLHLPVELPGVCSSWHLYPVRLDRRDDLADFLKVLGISTGVHYKPSHLYELYAPYRARLPVTEREWTRLLSLPIHPDMSDADVYRVIEGIRAFGRV